MAKVYNSICNEADLLLIRITHLVEKEIKYKINMEKLMNKGFVNIAKARYIMGSTCVTKMQLPTEKSNPIQPLATVCRAQLNDHWVFHIHRKDDGTKGTEENDGNLKTFSADINTLHLNDYKNYDGERFQFGSTDNYETEFRNALQNDPKGLKKSKNAFSVGDKKYQECNEELLDEFSTDSGSSDSLYSLADPLRLFGVLVPNTLKQAQNVFKEVVNLIGKCATLQSELREALHRYNHLQKVKNLIEIAALEAKFDISQPKLHDTPSKVSSILCHTCSNQNIEETDEKPYGITVTKSIRSVFYDLKDEEQQESELSIWDGKSIISDHPQ